MKSTDLISVISLLIALVAVLSSWRLSRQALSLNEIENHRATVVDLFKPLADPSFFEKETGLWRELPNHSPSSVADLPDSIRSDFVEVSLTYQVLAAMIRFGYINADLLISQWGYHALRTWDAIERHVQAERQVREIEMGPGRSSGYLESFEDLAHTIRSADFDAVERRLTRSRSDLSPRRPPH